MANAFRLSNGVAKAMADAFTTYNDGGSAALIRIYNGTQPADPDTAITSQTLLAELTMSATSFGAASDANPGGRITANAITGDASANATGTASWFRIVTQAGGNTVCDGSVGTASADLVLNSVDIVTLATVDISSFTITMRET